MTGPRAVHGIRAVRYYDLCLGRGALLESVVASAQERRSVLLFGGRQSGKTTLLRNIQIRMAEELKGVGKFGGSPVCVYVDLLTLPFDARPSDFFSLLTRLAATACQTMIPEENAKYLKMANDASASTVDEFQDSLRLLFHGSGGLAEEFVFLLDESKRILGRRFPRGFQDNLFALLYGDEVSIRLSFVFSGAQDLYSLLEDSTSPIGSRSAVHFIQNLTRTDIQSMLAHFHKHVDGSGDYGDHEELAGFVYEQTGGHAGVSSRLAETIVNSVSRGRDHFGPEQFEMDFMPQIAWLFQHWCRCFTREADLVLDFFSSKDELRLREIANLLEQNGYNRFLSDLVWIELQYTGIAIERDHSILTKMSRAFWRYRGKFDTTTSGSAGTKDAWKMIEEAEISLRGFVKSRFEGKWGDKSLQTMKRILGTGAWAKLESIRGRSDRYYPYARNKIQRDIMECMYLGQLGNLMLDNSAWPLFRNAFRDKRQLQDILAAITPVRNDRGHFVSVDDKELRRCEINCDDLSVIIEKELERSTI